MYEFAKVVAGLAALPDLLAKLIDAVETENAGAYAELVKKLGFERYCHQLCYWLCRLSCRRFCRCVCPPSDTIPLFTHVGVMWTRSTATSRPTARQRPEAMRLLERFR